MRDKLYRVWIPTGDNCGRMEYFSLFDAGSDMHGEGIFGSVSVSDLKKYPVMEFTGLKDKNGKDIYEGDILDNRKIVSWQDITDGGPLLGVGFNVASDYDCYFEIIGNIFRNPELLEKK